MEHKKVPGSVDVDDPLDRFAKNMMGQLQESKSKEEAETGKMLADLRQHIHDLKVENDKKRQALHTLNMFTVLAHGINPLLAELKTIKTHAKMDAWLNTLTNHLKQFHFRVGCAASDLFGAHFFNQDIDLMKAILQSALQEGLNEIKRRWKDIGKLSDSQKKAAIEGMILSRLDNPKNYAKTVEGFASWEAEETSRVDAWLNFSTGTHFYTGAPCQDSLSIQTMRAIETIGAEKTISKFMELLLQDQYENNPQIREQIAKSENPQLLTKMNDRLRLESRINQRKKSLLPGDEKKLEELNNTITHEQQLWMQNIHQLFTSLLNELSKHPVILKLFKEEAINNFLKTSFIENFVKDIYGISYTTSSAESKTGDETSSAEKERAITDFVSATEHVEDILQEALEPQLLQLATGQDKDEKLNVAATPSTIKVGKK